MHPAYVQLPSSTLAAARWSEAIEFVQPYVTVGHEPSSYNAVGLKLDRRLSVQPPTTHEPSSMTANDLKLGALEVVQPSGGGGEGGGGDGGG